MARVTVEDCIDKVTNRFDLVLLAAQRAREISGGAALTIDRDRDKNPVVALREIADETVLPAELKHDLIASLQKVQVDDDDTPDEIGSLQASAEALRAHPPALQAAEELVKKIARFGKRWRDIEDQARRSDRGKLAARLAELNRRRDESSDEQTRAEYERANIEAYYFYKAMRERRQQEQQQQQKQQTPQVQQTQQSSR